MAEKERPLARFGVLVLAAAVVVCVLALGQASPAASAAGAVLIGNQAVEYHHDSGAAGVAEAFRATAVASGAASDVFVFVDGAPPTRLTAGLYANAGGHPGARLARGTLAGPRGGVWNDVPLTSTASLTAGTVYWIAILSPAGTGTLKFRDRRSSGASETSLSTTLGSLPSNWSTGTRYTEAFVSAYALVGTATPDTSPPTQPSSFAVTATTASSVSTSWTASTDNVGVSGYTLYLDGAQVGTPTATSFTFSSLACGTSHTGGVEARDAAGNVSARRSLAFTVGACGGTPPPPPPPPGSITVKKVFEGSDTDRVTHSFKLSAAVPVGHTLILTHVSTIDATDGTGGIVTPAGVSDQGGNAWSQAAVSHPGTSFDTVEVWRALVTSPLPAGAIVTVKGYSRGLSDEIAIFDVTGLSASPVDQKAAYAGYSQKPATPYITPTQGHVLLVAVHGQSSSGAPWWTPEAATPAWTKVVDRFDGGNIARGMAVDVREVTVQAAYRSAGTAKSAVTSNNLIVALRAAG